MKKIILSLGVFTSLLALAASLSSEDKRAPLEIRESGEGVLFLEEGKKVLFYQRRPKSLAGEFERAHYIHPLYGLDGEILTEDFPRDHLHHHGIFWAWHQLSVAGKKLGDPWISKDFGLDVKEVKTFPVDARSSSLKAVVLWKSPLWVDSGGAQKPLVEETTYIRIHRTAEQKRKIDFQIILVALENELRLGGSEDEKGYGGFSPRIWLPQGVRFTGRDGAVKPDINQVRAGPWLDLSGSFGGGGKVSGIAILTHPSLPVFPPPWILRERASMQNAVYPGRDPVLLPRGKPLALRYRLVVHRGDAGQAGIDRLQAEYEAEPLPRFN